MRFRRAVNLLAIALLAISVARLLTRHLNATRAPAVHEIDPLAVRVPAMSFSHEGLVELTAELSAKSGVRITIDPAVGDPEASIGLDAAPSSLIEDLDMILSATTGTPVASVQKTGIRIMPAAAQPRTLRIYDVRDLRQKVADELWQEEELGKVSVQTQGLFVPRTGIINGNYGPPPQSPGPTRQHNPPSWSATLADATDVLVHAIRERVTPNDWIEEGGAMASLRGADGRLVVYHTAAGHQAVEELLAAIRTANKIRPSGDLQAHKP